MLLLVSELLLRVADLTAGVGERNNGSIDCDRVRCEDAGGDFGGERCTWVALLCADGLRLRERRQPRGSAVPEATAGAASTLALGPLSSCTSPGLVALSLRDLFVDSIT